MIETITISVLSVLVVIFGFTTFNLLRKNEKQEDILDNQENVLAGYLDYLDKISRTMKLGFSLNPSRAFRIS